MAAVIIGIVAGVGEKLLTIVAERVLAPSLDPLPVLPPPPTIAVAMALPRPHGAQG